MRYKTGLCVLLVWCVGSFAQQRSAWVELTEAERSSLRQMNRGKKIDYILETLQQIDQNSLAPTKALNLTHELNAAHRTMVRVSEASIMGLTLLHWIFFSDNIDEYLLRLLKSYESDRYVRSMIRKFSTQGQSKIIETKNMFLEVFKYGDEYRLVHSFELSKQNSVSFHHQYKILSDQSLAKVSIEHPLVVKQQGYGQFPHTLEGIIKLKPNWWKEHKHELFKAVLEEKKTNQGFSKVEQFFQIATPGLTKKIKTTDFRAIGGAAVFVGILTLFAEVWLSSNASDEEHLKLLLMESQSCMQEGKVDLNCFGRKLNASPYAYAETLYNLAYMLKKVEKNKQYFLKQ